MASPAVRTVSTVHNTSERKYFMVIPPKTSICGAKLQYNILVRRDIDHGKDS